MLVVVLVFTLFFIFHALLTADVPKKNVRNYKVRFDAASEKYYIVNELETHDEPVTGRFGSRVMYKEKLKAEHVTQKYNA